MKFWWNYQNTLQWWVTGQFSPSISLHPEYDYGYGYLSNPISYSFPAQSNNDDSLNELLETISNVHTLIKDFPNHHPIEISWMQSPLTRVDRFLVDLLITSICNSPYPVSPRAWLSVMIEYELKYGFMHTRYHGSLRSKDHMHYSHYENYLLTNR